MGNKKINPIILFVIFIFSFSFFLNSQSISYPEPIITVFTSIRDVYDNLAFIEEFETKVEKSLRKVYKTMWEDYEKGKGKLPSCVVEAMNMLKSQPIIEIDFSSGKDCFFGDESCSGRYYNKKITIYNAWRSFYTIADDETKYCTRAVLFHECLHYAFHITDLKYFNVRNIDNPNTTDNSNFPSDEGIVEDCELKLIPCGDKPYMRAAMDWTENGARKYNTEEDECILCKLCSSITSKSSQTMSRSSSSSGDECQENPSESHPGDDGKGNSSSGPAGDNADDNESYSSGIIKQYNLAPESVIFLNGFYEEALRLFGGLKFDGDNIARELLDATPVLIIPTGGLFGKEYDSTFKYIIEEYVKLGGTIIVLAQQYGTHFDSIVPVPSNQRIKSYGWREDQSCYSGSAYYDHIHPCLTAWSSWEGVGTLQTDGYFDIYPSDSTILLKRTKNRKPLLLYYPFGEGTVILTTMFTDWASAHGQNSKMERALMRDLITFARNARKPIPMISLSNGPTFSVNLGINITNNTDQVASKVKLTAYTPDRKKILHIEEVSVDLGPNGFTIIPFSFVVGWDMNDPNGICHVDYELFDAQDDLIGMATESDGGRFAVYNKEEAYKPNNPYDVWITTEKESFFWNEKPNMTLHVRNYSDNAVSINWYYDLSHESNGDIPSLIIAPGKEIATTVNFNFPARLSEYKESRFAFILHYKSSNESVYGSTLKGIFVKGNPTVSTIKIDSPSNRFKSGVPVNFSIHSSLAWEMQETLERQIRVSLLNSEGTIMGTIYETTHIFSLNNGFNYEGKFVPTSKLTPGYYRLKLEVFFPEQGEEIRFADFYYQRSNVWVQIDPIPEISNNILELNKQYPFHISLKNYSIFPQELENAKCVLSIISEKGDEAFRKELTGFKLQQNQILPIDESFIFLPPVFGKYRLKVVYEDETMDTPKIVYGSNLYQFKMQSRVNLQQDAYRYLDSAKIEAHINGIGNFKLVFDSPQTQIHEERNILLTSSNPDINEMFLVPIHFGTSPEYTLEITGDGNYHKHYSGIIPTIPLQFNLNALFNKENARVGDNVELSILALETSGFTSPIPARLRIYSAESSFNIDTYSDITLQPFTKNTFTHSLTVPAEVTENYLPVHVELLIENQIAASCNALFFIPDQQLVFQKTTGTYGAGDTFLTTAENSGGKDGRFNFVISLKDIKGKECFHFEEERDIPAGQTTDMNVIIPSDSGSGNYVLTRKAVNMVTSESVMDYSAITVTGLSVSLNSLTTKDAYNANELVSGKSEISCGTYPVNNAALEAEIVRFKMGKGTERIFDIVNCMTVDNLERLWVGTEYGVSVFDGSNWQEYTLLPDGSSMDRVTSIVTGIDNKVYALCSSGIIVFDCSSINLIPHNSRYWRSGPAVDTLSRIWMNYSGEMSEVYYYDMGEWHYFHYGNYSFILPDKNGGVWLIGSNTIIHADAELSRTTFTPPDVFLYGGVLDAYVGVDGKLWLIANENSSLYSFDGSNWTDYSSVEGFPEYGMIAITGDREGKIYGIGTTADWYNDIYPFNSGKFGKLNSLFRAESSGYHMDACLSQGYIYINGSFGDTGEGGTEFEYGLLKLGGSGGLIRETPWTGTLPFTGNPGSSVTLDYNTAASFEPGAYRLNTRLLSSSGQVLAESSHPFTVKGNGISASILTPNLASDYMKTRSDLPVMIDITDNTVEPVTGVNLVVRKVSPDGAGEDILNEILDLQPGQSEIRNLIFNESLSGTWQIDVQLKENETLLSSSRLLLQVVEPSIKMDILSPVYAANNEPYDISIRLINESTVASTLSIGASVPDVSTPLIDESVTLAPLEERIITFQDTLTGQLGKTYKITFDGDVQKTVDKTVKYKYSQSIAFNMSPVYREGIITIPFTVTADEFDAFTDILSVRLYAVGSTVPLQTLEKSYSLESGVSGGNGISSITGSITFMLSPGQYRFTYSTEKNPVEQESFFTVQPSGIGTMAFTPAPDENGAIICPTGTFSLSYTLSNSDSVEGNIPLTFTLLASQTLIPISQSTRSYYLLPGQMQEDYLTFDVPQRGDYIIRITGSKLNPASPSNLFVRVLPSDSVTASITIGAAQSGQNTPGGMLPYTVSIENTGYNAFDGTVVIQADGIRHEETLHVPSLSSFNQTFMFNTEVLNPGSPTVDAFIYDSSGNSLSETQQTVVVQPADIKLEEIPASLEVTAGNFIPVPLTIKNEGHHRGQAFLRVRTFDNLFEEREINLEPGEEIALQGIFIDAPSDLPGGNYPLYYSLTGSGIIGGTIDGIIQFKVNGLQTDVTASLDRTMYNEGDTARLTLNIHSNTPSASALEAVVNWGEFNEKKTVDISTGSTTITFDIPLDVKREDKVFYGIYHEGGKGIYLNDIYLNFSGPVNVELDKQIYAPGDVIYALFSSAKSGILTVTAFDQTQTLALSSSVSASFSVPSYTSGGTYGITWHLESTDTTEASLDGNKYFDVSGIVVKTAKADLDKGKYVRGDMINTLYIFESNRDELLTLRCWLFTPSGKWNFLGQSDITLSSSSQTITHTSYSFDTTEAGTHELVYALYHPMDTAGKPILSGRLGFDSGDAVLTGLETDKSQYTEGTENVIVTLHHFGQGSPQLQLFLDDHIVADQSLTLNGIGSTPITLSSDIISGGSHILKAVLTLNGLTSTKTATFLYGTNLPDLLFDYIDMAEDRFDYTFKAFVSNNGKTPSSSVSLSLTDNESPVETKTIPILQPGQSQEIDFTWNGAGKAGNHSFLFTIDPSNTLKEYSENNNMREMTLDVPNLLYALEIQPSVIAANTTMIITTRLTNNQSISLPVTMNLSLTNNETQQEIYQRTRTEELTPMVNNAYTDTFNTATYPAGQYTLTQTIVGDNIDTVKTLDIEIQPTKAITAQATVTPNIVASGIETNLQLTLALKNAGNISLEDETLTIDIFHNEIGDVVKTDTMTLSLPIAGEKTEQKTLLVNLVEGTYELRVKYNDETIATTEFKAASAVQPEKTLDIKPRALIMNLTLPLIGHPQVDFITGLLNAAGIENETGRGILDSFYKWHKGYSNVNIVFGSMMGRIMRDELKERVWHGEGLIYIVDNPIQATDMEEFLGVRIKPAPGNARESKIHILPSDFSSESDIELSQKNQLVFNQVASDVTIIGQTLQKKYPVIGYKPYGKGNILIISIPLQFKSNSAAVSQLLLNAVAAFSKDIYSENELSRLLPLHILLKNKADSEKTITVKELFPYGVEGMDYNPKPAEGEELKWSITIPANQTKEISYWLKLPDKVDSYTIKTELYENESKLEGAELSFDVTETVLSRLDKLVIELEGLEAPGKDSRNIRKAITALTSIRSRACVTTSNCTSVLDYFYDLRDAVHAASYMSEVTGIDMTTLRLETEDIIILTGRRLYEKIKADGTLLLNMLNVSIVSE